jgi:hypothetical protein
MALMQVARSLLLTSLLTSTGCSALFVRTPARTSRPPHDCRSRYVAASFDAVVALTGLIGFIYALSMRDTSSEHFDPYDFVLAPIALPTIGFGMSAVHGFVAANRCVEIDRSWTATAQPPLQPMTPATGLFPK